MPDTNPTDLLDAELRRIAEALVASAPDVPDLVDRPVQPMSGRRAPSRRRPLAAGAAVAAVILLAGGVLAVVFGGHADDAQPEVVLAGGDDPHAPQRLILQGGRELPLGELPLDGDPVALETGGLGLDPWAAWALPRPLPGGGHVVVGPHQPPVAARPDDVDEFTEVTYGLAVVGADGRVEVERDIAPSTLAGVTATEAVLTRQPRNERGAPSGAAVVVAHDLTTGEERVVRDDDAFDPDRWTGAASAVVAGDLVIVEASRRVQHLDDGTPSAVPESESCTLRVVDLATGDAHEQPLDLDCGLVLGVQPSPDGSQMAVAYEAVYAGPEFLPEWRLAAVDLADASVGHDELVGHQVDCVPGESCPHGSSPRVFYAGMAWLDASRIRLAMVDLDSTAADLIVETIELG